MGFSPLTEGLAHEKDDRQRRPCRNLRQAQPAEDQRAVFAEGFEEETRAGGQSGEGEEEKTGGRLSLLRPEPAKD